MASLKEPFKHLHILCFPKLYTLSVGQSRHSYHNKLLPNYSDDNFFELAQFILGSDYRYA